MSSPQTTSAHDVAVAELEGIRNRLAAINEAAAAIEKERDQAYVRARDAGVTLRQIAAIFGITPGAVMQKERRARGKEA